MSFPSTLLEASRYFSNEEKCHNFMVSMRWADGKITCPHCGSEKIGKLVVTTRETPDRTLKSGKFVKGQTLTRRLWNCAGCKKQFTAKVGTIFEDSPLGLDKWLPAVWLIVNAKNGVSSYEIHRSLGVTQKSAWFMGHRIRTALHEGNFMKMSGQVEVDETYVGAKAAAMNKKAKRNKPSGTGMVGKTVVQGLLERTTETKPSRVKVAVVGSARREHVLPPVMHSVEPGSEIHTDSLPSYIPLKEHYTHNVIDHHVAYVRDHVHTNGLENFWCLLKRTLRGTYVCPRDFHLNYYLDEQAFRFNERRDNDQGRFLKAMAGTDGKRLTYDALLDGKIPALRRIA